MIKISLLVIFVAFEGRDCISQGKIAESGSFPYAVAFSDEFRPQCTGAILNDRNVMTSAFCGNKVENLSLVIHYGLHDASRSSVMRVQKVIIHPEYNENTGEHDIAIVKTIADFQYSDIVKSVRLPTSNQPMQAGIAVVVAGFGDTEVSKNNHIKII